MTENQSEIFQDRRKGPDLWVRSLGWLALGGWLSMFIALLIVGKAKPEVETFFDRYYKIQLRQSWDMELAQYILYMMIAGVFISVIGLFVNVRRKRRQSDELRVSLILIGLISVGSIVKYLISFS